jgi:hypothetical protein
MMMLLHLSDIGLRARHRYKNFYDLVAMRPLLV